jgi:hypothetical protein
MRHMFAAHSFRHKLFWVGWLVIFSSGCASTWVEPSTPRGRLCATECLIAQKQCMGNVNNSVANCANQVETELHAFNDPQIDSETACVASPMVTAAFADCDRNYRACFLGCGGLIR